MSCTLVEDRPLHNGYVRVWRNRRHVMLHRIIYEDAHGTLPADVDVHHECGVRNCVNLAHLSAIAHADHTRLHRPPRTHCPQGHPMTPENVYHYGSFRHCKVCAGDRQRRYRARLKLRRGREARQNGGAA